MNHEPMARVAGIRTVSDWVRVLLCALGMTGCATPAPPVAPLSDAETRLAAAAPAWPKRWPGWRRWSRARIEFTSRR
jgi:hypothetical protein